MPTAPAYIEDIPDSEGEWGSPCCSRRWQGQVVEAGSGLADAPEEEWSKPIERRDQLADGYFPGRLAAVCNRDSRRQRWDGSWERPVKDDECDVKSLSGVLGFSKLPRRETGNPGDFAFMRDWVRREMADAGDSLRLQCLESHAMRLGSPLHVLVNPFSSASVCCYYVHYRGSMMIRRVCGVLLFGVSADNSPQNHVAQVDFERKKNEERKKKTKS